MIFASNGAASRYRGAPVRSRAHGMRHSTLLRFGLRPGSAAAAMLLAILAGAARGAEQASAPAPKTFRDCADCPEMVVVPPGSFTMGSSAQERVREGVPGRFA